MIRSDSDKTKSGVGRTHSRAFCKVQSKTSSLHWASAETPLSGCHGCPLKERRRKSCGSWQPLPCCSICILLLHCLFPCQLSFMTEQVCFLKLSIAIKVTGNIFLSSQVLQLLFPTAVAGELKVWHVQLSTGSSFIGVHWNQSVTCSTRNSVPAVRF